MMTQKTVLDDEPEYSDLPGLGTTEIPETFQNQTEALSRVTTQGQEEVTTVDSLNSKFFKQSMAKSAGSGEIDGFKEIERGLLPDNPPLQPKVISGMLRRNL